MSEYSNLNSNNVYFLICERYAQGKIKLVQERRRGRANNIHQNGYGEECNLGLLGSILKGAIRLCKASVCQSKIKRMKNRFTSLYRISCDRSWAANCGSFFI